MRKWFLVAALVLVACGNDKSQQPLSGMVMSPPLAVGTLSLPDGSGAADFTFKAAPGHLLLSFFGYTNCPDVCPTTLGELAAVKRELGAEGAKVQGIFITVDPQRDTAEMLQAYVDSFDSGFVALRGTQEQLEATARDFKVIFSKVAGKTPTSYTMEHTAASFVYDPQGHIRLYARYGMGAQALADDLKLLLS